LEDRIDALLPQTQCGRCTYAACKPYAEAVASGAADINRCPPGGERTIRALAALLGRAPLPLAAEVGPEKPRQVAWIDESRCIGCARCIPACPVDAIIGAQQMAHAVIAGHCTGCELCLPPCPVDCIEIRACDDPGPKALQHGLGAAQAERLAELEEQRRADAARERFGRHQARLQAAAEAERRAFEDARRRARGEDVPGGPGTMPP
jgi:electron transport complex protein RnfB